MFNVTFILFLLHTNCTTWWDICSDCEAYIMAFFYYYAARKTDLLAVGFNIQTYQNRVASLLYHYARMMMDNACESEDKLGRSWLCFMQATGETQYVSYL